jgi:xylulokinase
MKCPSGAHPFTLDLEIDFCEPDLMSVDAVLGVDIGTSSSKGVLVTLDGTVLRSAIRSHSPSRPHPGWVEMDAALWWREFAEISRELMASVEIGTTGGETIEVVAVGVSGMGPCVLVTDADGTPLRPAILYGIDSRATTQIAALTARLGGDNAVMRRTGSALSTQAAGPKLVWLAENEPDVFSAARLLFMPSSWLAWKLTGAYLLDHHSASQCTPLYDATSESWYEPWAGPIIGAIELPPLCWPGDVVGRVTPTAAAEAGLPAGIPVIAGTIDAWSEAVSVGAQRPGDLMLMYGTTMFLINTVPALLAVPGLWGTVGAFPGTRNLAAGMATSGAITGWLKDLLGASDYPELLALAAASGPGARGLLMLPYFAGERTPIQDPDARGIIAGLTVEHSAGDLYRAALEATALGVRHNVEAMRAAGGTIDRIVAVGGGAQGALWTQIVSDVTGLPQIVPTVTIGASFGAAFLAAASVAHVDIDTWNPPAEVRRPDPALAAGYDELYGLYRSLYPATSEISHALAVRQRRSGDTHTDTHQKEEPSHDQLHASHPPGIHCGPGEDHLHRREWGPASPG